MALTPELKINLIESEIIKVNLTEKEIFEIKMYVVDKSIGATTLEQLLDTEIDTPSDGQILIYNATTQEWENGDVSGTVDPANFVQGEIPTPSPPVLVTEKFTTANNFVSSTLEVYLNGMKLQSSDITIYAPNQFSISTLDTIASDVITVNYFKS